MNSKHEIICIQAGQAGVQLGHAMWELLSIEHDITASGTINGPLDNAAIYAFFSESSNNQYFPRALIFDTEPTVLDEIRCGFYRKLFHPEMLVNGNQDASNNFARGYISEAKLMMFNLIEKTRQQIESCDNFSGFLVQSGTAGGTGSGLLSALMEHLLTEFAGRTNVQLSIFPGQKLSNCIVQPYNCTLSSEKLIHCSDLNIIVDNEMLYYIAYNHLDIHRPTFSNINRIICPILSGITAPIRFKGMINSDLKGISTNLVPYPNLHFPIVSFSPMISTEKFDYDLFNNESLTRSLFLPDNQFIEIDLKNGYFLSSVLLYRGNCDLSEILKTVQCLKKENDFQWVDWCPTGFKINHTVQRPISVPMHGPISYDKAATMISNHSGIGTNLGSMENQFYILFRKRAYLHWYLGEGMEENEFIDAINEVKIISIDYLNIGDRVSSNTEDQSLKTLNEAPETKLFEFQSDFKTNTEKISRSSNPGANKVKDNNVIDLQSDRKTSSKPSSNIFREINAASHQSDKETNSPRMKSQKIMRQSERKSTNPNKHNEAENLLSIKDSGNDRQKHNERVEDDLFSDNQQTNNAIYYLENHCKTNRLRSNFQSNNAINVIYEICERNYASRYLKPQLNDKRVLRQISLPKEAQHQNIIKKMYRKNRDLFNKFMHSDKYDLTL